MDLAPLVREEPVLTGPRSVGRPLLLLILILPPTGAASQSAPEGPLTFLEPLIGTWSPDPSWIADNPGMETLVPISFRWGPSRYSILDQAALPVRGRLYTVSQITWNPATRRAEFIATQSNDSLAFTGYYEPIGDRDIRRTYHVHYPDGSTVPFRETFFFLGDDVFDWLTEWNPDGRWVPRRGNGDPEFRMRRRVTAVDEEIAPFRGWLGTWGTEEGSTLTLRPADGTPAFRIDVREEGRRREGLLVWDPNAVGLRSVEVAGDGTLERVAWGVDDSGLVRVVDAFDPAGHARRWTERWSRPDSSGCFVETGTGTAIRSLRYCRVPDESGPQAEGGAGA